MEQMAAERTANLQAVQDSLGNLHRATAESAAHKWRRRRANINAATAATLPNFALGDFVLVGTIVGTHGHKLSIKWRGPRRITAVESDWVFQVQYLLTNSATAVHATRLKFYCDKDLEITEDLLAHIAHQQSGYEASRLKDLRWSPDDVPALVTNLLAQHPDKALVAKVRTALTVPE
jgi:hypothetical protein